jgi:hypothetical protein
LVKILKLISLGIAVDFTLSTIEFYLNEEKLGIAFSKISPPLSPAFNLNTSGCAIAYFPFAVERGFEKGTESKFKFKWKKSSIDSKEFESTKIISLPKDPYVIMTGQIVREGFFNSNLRATYALNPKTLKVKELIKESNVTGQISSLLETKENSIRNKLFQKFPGSSLQFLTRIRISCQLFIVPN